MCVLVKVKIGSCDVLVELVVFDELAVEEGDEE